MIAEARLNFKVQKNLLYNKSKKFFGKMSKNASKKFVQTTRWQDFKTTKDSNLSFEIIFKALPISIKTFLDYNFANVAPHYRIRFNNLNLSLSDVWLVAENILGRDF